MQNTRQIKATVAIFVSNKVNFRTRKITRDKRKTHHNGKRSIHQENITILNVCT